MAQLRAACAYSHAIGAACRANNALTTRRARCRTTFHAPQHQSWRARRRHAAAIGALTARNAKLAAENTELTTQNSALTAANSKLAAKCGAAVVDASATSEASLEEGNVHAHALTRALTLVGAHKASHPVGAPRVTTESTL